MATLKQWNEGIAWYFLDRDEADQSKSRLGMTKQTLAEIGKYVSKGKFSSPDEAAVDLLWSLIDEEDRADNCSRGNYPDEVFDNGRDLVDRYNRWLKDGDDGSGGTYPGIVPPFLAHLAICPLALNMEGATGNGIYPWIAKFLARHLKDGKDSEEIEKKIRKEYMGSGFWSGHTGFSEKNVKVEWKGDEKTENVWAHIKSWSEARFEQNNEQGGRFVSVAAGSFAKVLPIRYAAEIRGRDDEVFGEILKAITGRFEPSRDSLRVALIDHYNDLGRAIQTRINRNELEVILDHIINRWKNDDYPKPGDGSNGPQEPTRVVFQVEPIIWTNKDYVPEVGISRLRQLKGANFTGDVKMVFQGHDDITLTIKRGYSTNIATQDLQGLIWKGDFQLTDEDGADLDSLNVKEILEDRKLKMSYSFSDKLWIPNESPAVGQNIAEMEVDSANADHLLTKLVGKETSFRTQGTEASTNTSKSETKIGFEGGIRMPTGKGEYLRVSVPSLVVKKGNIDHVSLYPDKSKGGDERWENYLAQAPEKIDNGWTLVPLNDVSEVKISWIIAGDGIIEKKRFLIADEADLWRGGKPEEDMSSEVTTPSGNKSGDIGALFGRLSDEYESRIGIVRMNLERKYRRADEDASIEGIGLADLLKFSNLKMRDFQEEERREKERIEKERKEKERKEREREEREREDKELERISERIQEQQKEREEAIRKIEEEKERSEKAIVDKINKKIPEFQEEKAGEANGSEDHVEKDIEEIESVVGDAQEKKLGDEANKRSRADRNQEIRRLRKANIGQLARRVLHHANNHPNDRTAKEFIARREKALRGIPKGFRISIRS